MNKTFVFLLLFFLISLHLQAQNQFDAQGKRHGVWIKKYPNGNIRYRGTFEHGKEVGIFKFYAVTGQKHPVAVKEYTTDSDIVKVSFYSLKGKLESEGKMRGKKRTGLWKYYFPDGKSLLATENYKEGLLDGVSKTYYKNGKLAEEAHYKMGKLHGKHVRYADTGKTVEQLTYKDGVMDGPAVFYDEKGEIFARGNYEKGVKTGIWEFNMDGEMVKSAPEKIHLKKRK